MGIAQGVRLSSPVPKLHTAPTIGQEGSPHNEKLFFLLWYAPYPGKTSNYSSFPFL